MSQRALVIEPEAPIARLIEELLKREFGFSVERVLSIADGVKALHAAKFAAVVIDISRSAGGLETVTELTKGHEAGVVVITTGRLDRKTLELFVSDHVYAVVPKPFDIEMLATSVREALDFARRGAPMSSKLLGFLANRQKH